MKNKYFNDAIIGGKNITASYTYKYDVTFMSDSAEYDTQIVTSGNYATEPSQPTKTGYTFKGWSSYPSINLRSKLIFLKLIPK